MSDNVLQVSDDNFEAEILKKRGPRPGRFLGILVRALSRHRSRGRGTGRAVRRQAEGGQAQRGREPQDSRPIRHPRHPHPDPVQGRQGGRSDYRRGEQVAPGNGYQQSSWAKVKTSRCLLHDMVIIGGGAGGPYRRTCTPPGPAWTWCCLERLSPGGQVLTTDVVENWPGDVEGVSADSSWPIACATTR